MEHKQWPARATFDKRELGIGDVHYALFPFLCVACHLLDNLLVVRDVAVCPRSVSRSMPKPILTLIRETCQAGSLTMFGLQGRAITVLYSPHQTAIREVLSTMRLDGKVALISGGARGQGATEARLFAREGAKVVIGDLLEEAGKQVEAEINASGGTCLFVKLDVTKAEDWQHAVAAAVAPVRALHGAGDKAGQGGHVRLRQAGCDESRRLAACRCGSCSPLRHAARAGEQCRHRQHPWPRRR